MIVDCIADLHGHYPKLEGGDLLIVAGDLTARDTTEQNSEFNAWLYKQDYKKKVVVAGNHDNSFIDIPSGPLIFSTWNTKIEYQKSYADYLCDSGTEFEGLKIWGSPWTLTFPGINPRCTAFTGTEDIIRSKVSMIPHDTDILITHGPAFTILDETKKGINAGSHSLYLWLLFHEKLKLHVCGHIHESYGRAEIHPDAQYYNCSHVNERYEPVNAPVRVIL